MPLEDHAPRRSARTWVGAAGGAALALWTPFLVAALASERVRRIGGEFWLWPGLVPGHWLIEDLYSPLHGLVTLAQSTVWTLAVRRFGWPGLLGALVAGSFSAARLMALLSI